VDTPGGWVDATELPSVRSDDDADELCVGRRIFLVGICSINRSFLVLALIKLFLIDEKD